MLRLVETERSSDAVDAVAVEVLRVLFEAVTGTPPRRLRAYRDDDALLLALRYEPTRPLATDPPVEVVLMALAQLVAEAVAKRTRQTLASAGVSVAEPKGLAVLAFSVAEDSRADAGRRLSG